MGMRTTALLTAPSGQAHAPSTSDASAALPLQVAAVYEAHVEFVWRTARRLGTQEQHLDDVVQEVFIVVQRRLADFEGRSALRTWLFGITRRVVRASMRRVARRGETALTEPAELADPSAQSAESQLVELEGSRLLHALLAELDDDKREVFVLSELEEMSGPEI